MIQKNLKITDEQEQYLKDRTISFTQYVRKKINEDIKASKDVHQSDTDSNFNINTGT